MAELQGFVDHIVYRNADNGYTVLELQTDDGEEILTGIFRTIEEGELILVQGERVHHPSYGEQFKVISYEIKEPEDIVAIERYLASGAIKGIGAVMAKRIIKAFGEDSFRIMEEEPERLSEIKGISERIARSIAEQMQEKRGMRKAMMFLQQLGVGSALAVKIYAFYENELFDIIKKNPYRLIEDIDGVGFITADEIARQLGISNDSVYRVKSGILYTLAQAASEGHMCLCEKELMTKAYELLEIDEQQVQYAVDDLIMEGKLISKVKDETAWIYSAGGYYTELGCARLLVDLNIKERLDENKIEAKIREIETGMNTALDDIQRQAVVQSCINGISIITGGPGTGKTTITKILLEYFDKTGQDVMLCAPTGRAAKRMTEATGYEARTIHRMLEIGGDSGMVFARNEENPLETDVVIVDEMSMVDIYLFHALLKAVAIGTKLILVGDVNQLPSVGPGSVLKDIIMSEAFSVTVLKKIFRQDAKSDIVVNAHRINNGQQISLDNKSNDFFFLERNDIRVIIEGVVYLVTKKLPPYVKAKPFDIQVMTPMKKGALGVANLNKVLQERLNPPEKGKEEVVYGDDTFRVGDKVMQIKNNYQLEWEVLGKYDIVVEHGLGVFNGDMGVIKEIDRAAGTIKVMFDDNRTVSYTTALLGELELAYAITIHKSQGSEYPAVVMPLLNGPAMLFNRNLLYTAVTRAKKCVTIIGSRDTIFEMIENENEQTRYTSLDDRIREVMCEEL